MADGTLGAVEVDERPLPTLEEMAALLFSRPDGEAGHAKRRVLMMYAREWATYEGVPAWKAVQMAERLMDAAEMTAAERLSEECR